MPLYQVSCNLASGLRAGAALGTSEDYDESLIIIVATGLPSQSFGGQWVLLSAYVAVVITY